MTSPQKHKRGKKKRKKCFHGSVITRNYLNFTTNLQVQFIELRPGSVPAMTEALRSVTHFQASAGVLESSLGAVCLLLLLCFSMSQSTHLAVQGVFLGFLEKLRPAEGCTYLL